MASMGLDRSLDAEGIPDLDGPLPGKVATGDPQEGAPPPSDHPAASDYGVTAAEHSRPEPLDSRLARELVDDEVHADTEGALLVAPEDDDDMPGGVDNEKDLVARRVESGAEELSAEEAAMHVVEAP
jgi:hypothetical protein